jgi:hypothetical protein
MYRHLDGRLMDRHTLEQLLLQASRTCGSLGRDLGPVPDHVREELLRMAEAGSIRDTADVLAFLER